MLETLKTLVLKTAKVTGVKLGTPADRIGLGLVVATYPTDNLSPGQIPMPHNPEPEQARVWQLSSTRMQRHLRSRSDSDAVPPVGLGRPGCFPGSSALRSASSSAYSSTGSWRGTTRTAATGDSRRNAEALFAVPGRVHFPDDLGRDDRLGDCQSPERFSGKREIATRRVTPAAAVGK